MKALLGLEQEADLDNAMLIITFRSIPKFIDNRDVYKEVANNIVSGLYRFGARDEDIEVDYG